MYVCMTVLYLVIALTFVMIHWKIQYMNNFTLHIVHCTCSVQGVYPQQKGSSVLEFTFKIVERKLIYYVELFGQTTNADRV